MPNPPSALQSPVLPTRRLSSTYRDDPAFKPEENVSTWDELFPVPASDSRADQWKAYRRSLSYGIILLFLVAVVGTACFGGEKTAVNRTPGGFAGGTTAGVNDVGLSAEAEGLDDDELSEQAKVEPGAFADDHSHYHLYSSVSADDLNLDKPDRRVFFVGDIHGSLKQLNKLLDKLDYDEKKDVFVHVGDLVAKGPKSVEALELMRKYNVRGVRGNHDQPVIQWRSWFEKYLPVDSISSTSEEEHDAAFTALVDDLTLDKAQKMGGFPKEWKWEGEHFMVAKRMSRQDYAYLLSLPLQLHFPSLHSVVVHAGLLPFDPRSHKNFDYDALSMPTLSWQNPALSRLESEQALLQVSPNTDPWTITNMRSVLRNGKITKDGKEGVEWAKIYNAAMDQCHRTDASSLESEDEVDAEGKKKGCWPTTVLYGHAAGRGLSIRDHSIGLDSGCVYGKQLSALVLGDQKRGKKGKKVQVGSREGRIVSVEC